jgi:hypothetical protein
MDCMRNGRIYGRLTGSIWWVETCTLSEVSLHSDMVFPLSKRIFLLFCWISLSSRLCRVAKVLSNIQKFKTFCNYAVLSPGSSSLLPSKHVYVMLHPFHKVRRVVTWMSLNSVLIRFSSHVNYFFLSLCGGNQCRMRSASPRCGPKP